MRLSTVALVALVGLAVAGTPTVASAQGRGRGGAAQGARAGMLDTVRARRMDSLRAVRGDSARRRGGPDSLRVGGRGGLAGINLTESEKASLKSINQKYVAEMKALRQANGGRAAGQSAELRAQMLGIAQRERAEIRAALSSEHQTQFDANIAKGRGGRGRGGPPPGRPPRHERGFGQNR